MTPQELESLALSAYGPGWQTKLARDLQVSAPTVWRWAHGRRSISRVTELAILTTINNIKDR